MEYSFMSWSQNDDEPVLIGCGVCGGGRESWPGRVATWAGWPGASTRAPGEYDACFRHFGLSSQSDVMLPTA